MREQQINILTEDDESVALWRFSSFQHQSTQHVFLSHGTFSNRKVCTGIAEFLTECGYTCWLLEWRNHGSSPPAKTKFTFETVGKYDFTAALNYIFTQEKVDRLSCITHSGGGLCLTMCLIHHPHFMDKIDSLSIFCCQAFGAAHTLKNRLKIMGIKTVSALLGEFPAERTGLGVHNETHHTMNMWFKWNLHKNFHGEDGFDYREKMPLIQLPILSICAKGDTLIAPKEGCQQFLDAYQNEQNQLLYCSIENGYAEDYTHSRILQSRNAKKEIWPQVLQWIQQHAQQP